MTNTTNDLLSRYLDDPADRRVQLELMQYLRAHPEEVDEILEYVADSAAMDFALNRSIPSLSYRVAKTREYGSSSENFVRDVVRASEMPSTRGRRVFSLRWPHVVAAAAAVLLVTVGVWKFATLGSKSAEDVIQTGKGQKIALRFDGEDTLVEMAENTKLRVVGGAVASSVASITEVVTVGSDKMIELEFGSINVSLMKQVEGRSFSVRSRQAEMTALGTRFSVTALADRTRLLVEEGRVRIRSSRTGSAQDVGAGGAAVVRDRDANVILPGKVLKRLDIGKLELGTPQGVAFDGKLVWLYILESATLVALDLDTLEISKRVKPEAPFPQHGSGACGLAWDGKSLWAWGGAGLLRAVDPETGKTVRELKLPQIKRNTAFDIRDGILWVCVGSPEYKDILRIDLGSGVTLSKTQVDSPTLSTRQADCMACGQEMLFVTVRRNAGIAVLRSEDAGSSYGYRVGDRNFIFYGGDIAYDPERGLWCVPGRPEVWLVEAE